MVLTIGSRDCQGIAPTLLYPVPNAKDHSVLSKFIHTIRDYYPLWQVCVLPLSCLFAFIFDLWDGGSLVHDWNSRYREVMVFKYDVEFPSHERCCFWFGCSF